MKKIIILALMGSLLWAGSLWNDTVGTPYGPSVAGKVGDIVLIRIDESHTAVQSADTSLRKNTEIQGQGSLSWSQAANFLNASRSNDSQNRAGYSARNNFDGSGKTGRSSRLQAQLTAQIYKVEKDRLFIRGVKKIIINNEEEEISIEGVLRRQDIGEDNMVMSSMISDAVVKIQGYGNVSKEQEKGFLARLVDWIF